jgi:hypothetical protein
MKNYLVEFTNSRKTITACGADVYEAIEKAVGKVLGKVVKHIHIQHTNSEYEMYGVTLADYKQISVYVITL